jgi:pimeloyl-ACP methyl ester carboxylesterase
MDQYSRGELVFDVINAGPADGPVVILLHGFPQQNTSWDAVIPKLTAEGYRCCGSSIPTGKDSTATAVDPVHTKQRSATD